MREAHPLGEIVMSNLDEIVANQANDPVPNEEPAAEAAAEAEPVVTEESAVSEAPAEEDSASAEEPASEAEQSAAPEAPAES